MLNNPRLPARKPDNPHREDVNQRTMDMIAETRQVPSSKDDVGEKPGANSTQSSDPAPARRSAATDVPRRRRHVKPASAKQGEAAVRVLLSVPTDAATNAALGELIDAAPGPQRSAMKRRVMVRATAHFIDDRASEPPVRGLQASQMKAIVRIPRDLVEAIIERDDPKRLRPTSDVIGCAFSPYLANLLRS